MDRPTTGKPLDVPDGGAIDPSGGSLDTPGVAAASDEDRAGARDVPKQGSLDLPPRQAGREDAPGPEDRERQEMPRLDDERTVPGVKQVRETLERTPGVPL